MSAESPVDLLRRAAEVAPTVLPGALGEAAMLWLRAETACHEGVPEAAESARRVLVSVAEEISGGEEVEVNFSVTVSTLGTAVGFAREVLALAEQQQTRPRPFQVGDEIRWKWCEDGGSGKWFKARLVEQHPPENPTGWAGAITDPGTFYAPEHGDRPVGHVVFFSEPSMTLVAEGKQ